MLKLKPFSVFLLVLGVSVGCNNARFTGKSGSTGKNPAPTAENPETPGSTPPPPGGQNPNTPGTNPGSSNPGTNPGGTNPGGTNPGGNPPTDEDCFWFGICDGEDPEQNDNPGQH